jgi:MATE family multidrug resistance protein
MELTETVRLAIPMAATQLGQVAMMTTDLVLLGRLGEDVVAAVALAHIVLFACFMLGTGLVAAVSPLAAQAFGAREPRMVRRALRVGLWAATLIGIPLTIAQLYGFEILSALGQAPATARLAGRYLDGLAWSMVPAWWFIALRSFMGAVNRPEPGLWITLAAIPANLVAAYVLIHGAFGLPRLDVFGAGLATTLVNLGMCAAGVWVCYARRPFRKYHVLGRFWRTDWPLMRQLIVIGAPISGMFALEYGLFAAAAILMGWIGTTALAAHQIALQFASVIFMVPFGIAQAATIRVGQAVGRRDAAGTRLAGFVAVGLGAGFMLTMVLFAIAARDLIPLAFLGNDTAHAAETIALTATLLLVGSTFFIADGIQSIAAGALRGLNDTRVPLLIAAVSFWVIGFTSSYTLAFAAGLEAVGIWIGFSISIAVYAALLIWRFHALTQRGYLPAVPTAI